MGKRFNLLLIIFGMVVLYACYYFVLPNIINLERLNPKITKYVKEKYGYNISLDKPDFKMGYSPSIWLKADKFVLLNDDKTIAMSVNKPVIKVSLLPLIIDRINLTYFSADNVFADIYYDNKREVTLGQYLIFKSTNFVVNADNSKILISNYKINLNDNVKKDTTKILGKYFNIDEYKLDKSLKASVNFEIISGSNKSVVNLFADTKLPFLKHLDKYTPELSFSVTNLSLAKFSNFINYFTNNRVSDISGLINLEIHSDKRIFGRKQYLSNLLIDNFYIKTNLFEKEYNYPGRILIKSNYLLENKELTIPSFTISSPKFSAKLSGSINKISSKYPVPNLDFKMYGAKIEDILDIFPYCTKLDDYTKINISELKKAAFKSNVDMNLKFSGNFVKPNIYGKIDITDAIFERPIKNAQKNPNIKLEFLKDIVKFNTDVSAGIDKIVKINGQIGLYGANNSNLMIESSDLIDLSEAQRLIIPLHKTFNFLLGPLPVMSLSGYGGIKLKFHGNKKSPHIFGQIVTSNASASFLEIPNLVLNDTNALINFDDSNAIFTLKNGTIDGKSAFISGECKLNGEFDFNAKLPNQDIGYLLAAFKNSSILNEFASKINLIEASSGACDFNANVKGHITDANDIIIGKNVHVKGEIILKSIKAKFVKTRRYVNNIFGKIKINDLAIDLNISSYIGAAKLELVGLINANEANLNFKLAKAYLTDVINTFAFNQISLNHTRVKDTSTIDLTGKYNGNIEDFDLNSLNISGNINFKNFNIVYNPYKMPITVSKGLITIKNNYMFLHKLSMLIGTMPAVVGGQINNFTDKSYFDLSIFSRPNQKFIDYIYNSRSVYPIKLKGKSVMTANLSGYKNKLNLKSNLNLEGNSSLYYMGATLGDEEHPVHLMINSSIEPNRLNIKHFNYDKLNSPQMSASGIISNSKTNPSFNNFKIITYVPTDMKIFNIIFKKPFIKRGKFNASLVLNGNAKEPVVRGYLNLFDLDIPFINSNIKSILLKFTQNDIIATVKGNVLENLFTLNVDAQNILKPPYVINNANINSEKLDINTIYEAIKEFELNNSIYESDKNTSKFDLKQLIIKNFDIVADNILVNKISARNLHATTSLINNKLNIENFNFQMAKGLMNGSVSYNLNNFNSSFKLTVKGADADVLLDTIFDLKGQIYGDLDGELNFTCVGSSQEKCIKTLNGKALFNVKNGRMPKLGSLEYLLKAGNLMKSGITGISVNGIMDFIVPLKTGSFDAIRGSVDINKGVMNKIQISSEGKDLNLFIIGEYDIASKLASMYVFGRLSRKISTILGPVGNLSLNTLFNTIPGVNLSKSSDTGLINNINKIPGLELSNKMFRVFAAEIHGDISGDDYVDSFRWIE